METGSKATPAQPSDTEFFDLKYANEPASYYYLILFIEHEYVKACWYHFAKNLVTGYATYELNPEHKEESLKSMLREKPFLKAEFREVIVLLSEAACSLEPKLLKGYDSKELLSLTHDVSDSEEVAKLKLVNLKATALFALPSHIGQIADKTWSKHQVMPAQIPLIEEALNRLKREEMKTEVIALVNSEQLHIIAIKDGQLVLSNSYFQSGKEDVAYYLLFAAEVLELDPESVPLWLCGSIEPKDESWTLLANYWKSMKVVKELPHLKISPAVKEAESANYAFLTHALLCVS